MKDILVKDIMNPDVIYIKPRDPLKKIVTILDKHDINGLPVVEEEKKVVGIVTERDILKYARWIIGQPVNNLNHIIEEGEEEVAESSQAVGQRAVDVVKLVASVTAETLMTKKVITVKKDLPVRDLVKMMNEYNINRVPIVNDRGELIGIVARADILQFFEICFENDQEDK